MCTRSKSCACVVQTQRTLIRPEDHTKGDKSYLSYRSGVASVGNKVQCLLPQTLKDQLKLEAEQRAHEGQGHRECDVHKEVGGGANESVPVCSSSFCCRSAPIPRMCQAGKEKQENIGFNRSATVPRMCQAGKKKQENIGFNKQLGSRSARRGKNPSLLPYIEEGPYLPVEYVVMKTRKRAGWSDVDEAVVVLSLPVTPVYSQTICIYISRCAAILPFLVLRITTYCVIG